MENEMEFRIKTTVNCVKELQELIKEIEKIEKEHNCNCTLLDVIMSL